MAINFATALNVFLKITNKTFFSVLTNNASFSLELVLCKETCIIDVIWSQQEAQRSLVHSSLSVYKTTTAPPPPTSQDTKRECFRNFCVEMCHQDPGTLSLQQNLVKLNFSLLYWTKLLKSLLIFIESLYSIKYWGWCFLLLLTRFWVNSNLLILFFECPFKFPLPSLTLTNDTLFQTQTFLFLSFVFI